MDLKTINLLFQDLIIEKAEIFRLLKFDQGDIPDHFNAMIDHELQVASKLCAISGGYQVIDSIEIDKSSQLITVGKTDFLVGKNISVYLQRAEKLALLLCTAGSGIEEHSQQLMRDGNYPEGFVADVIGSVVVEAAMDKIHAMLIADKEECGLKVSNRYSPGYCTWNVDEQKKLFSFFPENYAGIKLSQSSLMNPIKSISGIAGIGKDINYLAYACDTCTSVNCVFRGLK